MGHVVSLTSQISPSDTINQVYHYCSVFFFWYMPWFFFKSGMFYKEEDWRSTFEKSKRRLLRPWLQWSAVGLIVGFVIAIYKGSLSKYIITNGYGLIVTGAISDNAPLWFLLSLFIVRIAYSLLRQLGVNVWSIAIVGLIIGFLLSKISGFKPYYVANGFPALFFYALGNIIGRKQCLIGNKWIAILSILVIVFYYNWPSFVDFRMNNLLDGYYVIYCIMSLCAIVGWNALFKILGDVRLSLGGQILTSIGQRSMFYFCAHWVILKVLVSIFGDVLSGTWLFNSCFFLLLLCLFIMDKIIQKI